VESERFLSHDASIDAGGGRPERPGDFRQAGGETVSNGRTVKVVMGAAIAATNRPFAPMDFDLPTRPDHFDKDH
jgi:hypothetical protein